MAFKTLLKIELALPDENSSVEFKKEILLDFIPVALGPRLLFRQGETEINLGSDTYRSLAFDVLGNRYELYHRLELFIDPVDEDGIGDYARRVCKMLSTIGFEVEQEQLKEFYFSMSKNLN